MTDTLYNILFMSLTAIALLIIYRKLFFSAQKIKKQLITYSNKYKNIGTKEKIELKKNAARSLKTKKELRESENEIKLINQKINEITDEILKLISQNQTYYSIDDKVSTNFLSFEVIVSHNDYRTISNYVDEITIQSWRKGRKYIVWAEDILRAENKIKNRFPPNKGYVFGKMKEINIPEFINRDLNIN